MILAHNFPKRTDAMQPGFHSSSKSHQFPSFSSFPSSADFPGAAAAVALLSARLPLAPSWLGNFDSAAHSENLGARDSGCLMPGNNRAADDGSEVVAAGLAAAAAAGFVVELAREGTAALDAPAFFAEERLELAVASMYTLPLSLVSLSLLPLPSSSTTAAARDLPRAPAAARDADEGADAGFFVAAVLAVDARRFGAAAAASLEGAARRAFEAAAGA